MNTCRKDDLPYVEALTAHAVQDYWRLDILSILKLYKVQGLLPDDIQSSVIFKFRTTRMLLGGRLLRKELVH